jgi:hypothetical protein
MADFLPSSDRIIARVEDVVDQAKEVVHLLSPAINQLPETFSTKMWEALRRGVKIFVIYREINEEGEKHLVRLQHSRLIILRKSDLNTSVYFNEKEAVVTSLQFFGLREKTIEFGTYIRKTYASAMYGEIMSEFRTMLAHSMKMVIQDQKLVTEEEVYERKKQIFESQPKIEEPAPISTKILTVKEKQGVLLKIFARECPDCTVKVEDADRIRLYGKGIVLNLSGDRVDLIFVHYSALQARMEEVKAHISSKHPEVKVWVLYNRINLKLEYEKDITAMFFTMRDVVGVFNLIEG